MVSLPKLVTTYLISIAAIIAVVGVKITPAGNVLLGGEQESCVAISIEEPDFCATFDHKERIWTANWKWAMNEAPDQLRNVISEYSVSNKNRVAYGGLWITNGW